MIAEVFVGREPELIQLTVALERTVAGRGQILLISGEAGIGKTRLVEHFISEVAGERALLLWGRCWEGGGAPAYWPWAEVLEKCLVQSAMNLSPSLRDSIHEVRALISTSPGSADP